MYKSKVFDTFDYLTKFLNDNGILPSEIISISVFSYGVALVYYKAESEK